MPLKEIPTAWYNAGGVLANIVVLLSVLPLFLLGLNSFLAEGLVIFCLTDIFLILMNGIPMKLNGISNDGYNIIYLNRNLLSKRAVVLQSHKNPKRYTPGEIQAIKVMRANPHIPDDAKPPIPEEY